jgi:hypothetical protein
MSRNKTFTLRVNSDESKWLSFLAEHYQRTRSGLIRMLIHKALMNSFQCPRIGNIDLHNLILMEEDNEKSIIES